ncbi:hypothetical protein CEXT_615191 [Caerostris extrusa]|uniref:Uncharacterized protein n=1 Tax=Caerostris extrusa TaxID=172846 RepID=A0AAV4PQ86_CAEEX|nr:hypothetical protein CEXT_615191 [Caerostris extrusa]
MLKRQELLFDIELGLRTDTTSCGRLELVTLVVRTFGTGYFGGEDFWNWLLWWGGLLDLVTLVVRTFGTGYFGGDDFGTGYFGGEDFWNVTK